MRIWRTTRVLGTWIGARLDLRDERAAAAVEYGILVLLIAVVVLLGVQTLGNQASTSLDCTATSIGDQGATQC